MPFLHPKLIHCFKCIRLLSFKAIPEIKITFRSFGELFAEMIQYFIPNHESKKFQIIFFQKFVNGWNGVLMFLCVKQQVPALARRIKISKFPYIVH